MQPLRAAVLILIGLLTYTTAWCEAIDSSVASLKKSLNLSDQQTQELNKVVVESREKLLALRKEMREVNKKRQTGIDAILTAEQKKKYQELKTPKFPAAAEPPQMMPMESEPEQPKAE